MKDTSTIKTIELISKKDTFTINVDRKIINDIFKEKQTDTVQVLAIILPIIAALLTLFLTRLFDSISETKKFKNEILKENRVHRVKILKFLNELRTSLHKTNFPDAEMDDFYVWTADRMIGVNPFHDLKINCNILFNREIIDLTNKLYHNAEKINRDFDWNRKVHPSSSYSLGEEILNDLDSVIDKISQNIKSE